MSSESDLTSLKELASQLKVSDALLKKMLKDFSIEAKRQQNKLYLDQEAVKNIREILALRASGKKNQEIKEMFDAHKKDETSKKKKNPKKQKNTEEEKTLSKELPQEVIVEATEAINERKPDIDNERKLHIEDVSSYLEDEEKEDELKTLLSDEETLDNLQEQHLDSSEEIEEVSDKLSLRKVRRRQFSYRYIQNQIANDSKRVNYIKQKLKRGKISLREKMNLEDSLNKRSTLLAGWIHLLRWVRS